MVNRIDQSLALVLLCGGLLTLGCDSREPIRVYNVAKQPVSQGDSPADATDRMLAAYIVEDGTAWFFKMTGPVDAVAAQEATFRALVDSVRFEADAKEPSWTLPDGWKQTPGDGTRFATLFSAGEPALETSVIPLPYSADDPDQYALANLNRWRRQLQLPPVGLVEMLSEMERFKVDGAAAAYVNLQGTASDAPPFAGMSPGPMSAGPMVPPLAGGDADSPQPAGPKLPPSHPPIGPTPPVAGPAPPSSQPAGPAPPASNPPAGPAPPEDDGLTYELPKGWQRSAATAFSRAAFAVSGEGGQAGVTVTSAGGDLLSNVNRWRRQVGLEAITAAQLEASREKIKVDGADGDFFDLAGPQGAKPRRTILGVIAPVGDSTWFIKLTGDAALAEREKANFKKFVESLKFSK